MPLHYSFFDFIKLLIIHDDFKICSQFEISISFPAMVLPQNWTMFPIIEYENSLSLSYQLSRNSWPWLTTAGSRSSKSPLGTILDSRYLVKKLLCDSYRTCSSFNVLSLIAWYPACLVLWYVDDRRLGFIFTGSSTKIAVDSSLTISLLFDHKAEPTYVISVKCFLYN